MKFCFATEAFEMLPHVWAERLISDITGTGNVRDSTLRRSTGYALAFLSIMRSEPPSCVSPRTLCPDVLSTLVRLSLPSGEDLKECMKAIGWNLDPCQSFRSVSTAVTSQFGAHNGDGGNDQVS